MINWKEINHFSAEEFSEDPTHLAEPELIISLDQFRSVINKRIFPSPVKGALARIGGSPASQHYIGNSLRQPVRKTTAVDIFCEGIPLENYQTLLSLNLFNGVGIYLDTTGPDGLPWIMFHVDIRPLGFNKQFPLIWFTKKTQNKNQYFYPQNQPTNWNLFNDSRLSCVKQFGTSLSSTIDQNHIRRSSHLGKNPLL